MKRLLVIDHNIEPGKQGHQFYIYHPLHHATLAEPRLALDEIKPILNGKDVHHFDVYFGNAWVTSSELK